tara:strand:- start:3 stop:206 length:204 start_codon:yes stop_codon:yes gene_type:complete
MKTYKVELIKVNKEYISVVVDAENRKSALAIAKGMKQEDFDETEAVQATEWRVKKDWSLLDLLGIGK